MEFIYSVGTFDKVVHVWLVHDPGFYELELIMRNGQTNKPLKRVQGLESWPFPTFKGQPLEPIVYPKQPRIDDSWEEALL